MSQLRTLIGQSSPDPCVRSVYPKRLGEIERRGILASSSAYCRAYSDARISSSSGFGTQGAAWPSERSTVFHNASRACRFVFMFALV